MPIPTPLAPISGEGSFAALTGLAAMLVFGDIRLWAILVGGVFALMVVAVLVKGITGKDLDPPHDGA